MIKRKKGNGKKDRKREKKCIDYRKERTEEKGRRAWRECKLLMNMFPGK